jgi:hypothetical protein
MISFQVKPSDAVPVQALFGRLDLDNSSWLFFFDGEEKLQVVEIPFDMSTFVGEGFAPKPARRRG